MALALLLTLAVALLIAANALFVAVEFGYLTVNRDEVRQGAEELGVDLDEHFQNVLTAMQAG